MKTINFNTFQHISKNFFKGSSPSFALIEIIIAISVLSIGVFSVIAISGKSYGAISLQKNKLIALNLAKEEMEIIRARRDENWLTTTGCDGTVDACPSSRVEETTIRPTGNCDWRCDLGEDLLDIDYLGDTNTSSLYGPGNPGNCILTEGCPLFTEVCPATTARCPLSLDANNYYQHSGVQTTSFYRVTSVEQDTDLNGDGEINNDFSVIVTVCWQERGGRWHGICLEDHLYNWAH